MSADDLLPWLFAACAVLTALCIRMIERRLRYYDERFSALTRRVWILEGSPPSAPEDVQ
jgi:hypothetical protein